VIKDNEAIYDEQISPLMAQILEVCKAHDIPMVASFQLTPVDEDGNGPMLCTSAIPVDGQDERLEIARREIRRSPHFTATPKDAA
jgi:hypothetical protein